MNLIGRWTKQTTGTAAEKYPDEIEFKANGTYFGHSRKPGAFLWWDSGGFHVESEKPPARGAPVGDASGSVRISTANDAEIVCPFTIASGTLTFTDPEGVRVQYRRAD